MRTHHQNVIYKSGQELGYDLRDLDLFQGLESDLLDKLSEGVVFTTLKKGEFAFKTGDPADQLYIICSGNIKIYYSTLEGKEQILYVYNEGDFVGGLNVMEDDDYRYMGQALDDCVVAMVKKDAFLTYGMSSNLVLKRMISKSYERIRWAEELISRLSSTNARLKVAGVLVALKNEFGVVTKDGIKLELPMNREEMGSFAGLTRETMTRKLSEFKDAGLIEFQGSKTILIKDVDQLQAFSL